MACQPVKSRIGKGDDPTRTKTANELRLIFNNMPVALLALPDGFQHFAEFGHCVLKLYEPLALPDKLIFRQIFFHIFCSSIVIRDAADTIVRNVLSLCSVE